MHLILPFIFRIGLLLVNKISENGPKTQRYWVIDLIVAAFKETQIAAPTEVCAAKGVSKAFRWTSFFFAPFPSVNWQNWLTLSGRCINGARTRRWLAELSIKLESEGGYYPHIWGSLLVWVMDTMCFWIWGSVSPESCRDAKCLS